MGENSIKWGGGGYAVVFGTCLYVGIISMPIGTGELILFQLRVPINGLKLPIFGDIII